MSSGTGLIEISDISRPSRIKGESGRNMQQETRESENERKERLTHLALASKAVNPSLGFTRGCSCDATREGEKHKGEKHKGCCVNPSDSWSINYYSQLSSAISGI